MKIAKIFFFFFFAERSPFSPGDGYSHTRETAFPSHISSLVTPEHLTAWEAAMRRSGEGGHKGDANA